VVGDDLAVSGFTCCWAREVAKAAGEHGGCRWWMRMFIRKWDLFSGFSLYPELHHLGLAARLI
jgi:hypothetical protein